MPPRRWPARSSRSGTARLSSTSPASPGRCEMTPPAVTTPIHELDEAPAEARVQTRVPGMALPFDLVLALTTLALCAVSLVTLSGATSDDIPGDPNYYVKRQAAYFVVGLLMAVVLARVDYSRLREAKYVVYGVLIAGVLAVQAVGS